MRIAFCTWYYLYDPLLSSYWLFPFWIDWLRTFTTIDIKSFPSPSLYIFLLYFWWVDGWMELDRWIDGGFMIDGWMDRWMDWNIALYIGAHCFLHLILSVWSTSAFLLALSILDWLIKDIPLILADAHLYQPTAPRQERTNIAMCPVNNLWVQPASSAYVWWLMPFCLLPLLSIHLQNTST